jgi:hypothetical protein
MYLSLNAHALHEQLQSEKWNVVTQFTWVTTLRFLGTASCVLRSRSTASFAMNIAVVFHLDIFLLLQEQLMWREVSSSPHAMFPHVCKQMSKL